ncbi:recombinase family protein [Nocardia sp. NPDC051990]|uniref:recombinase family protein n=1 Tax=Nocardia sp. NPDC051990 TaxID=3155285 RepID=UPI00341CF570
MFADKKSGKNVECRELWRCVDCLRQGDTLVAPSVDRLGRSVQDLIAIVTGPRERRIGFRSLHEALDTSTSGRRLVFHVVHATAVEPILGLGRGQPRWLRTTAWYSA